MVAERLEDPLVAVVAGERVEEHDRPVELVVDVDRRDRDELEALVVDPHQLVGDDLAQRLVETGAAGVLVRARARGTAAADSHRRTLLWEWDETGGRGRSVEDDVAAQGALQLGDVRQGERGDGVPQLRPPARPGARAG